MPTTKPEKARLNTASKKRFSLVPAVAQQQMYKTLAALKPADLGTASAAEVAEIAVCLAVGEHDPVILAYPARGAQIVRTAARRVGCDLAENKIRGAKGGRLGAATLMAIRALFEEANATAVICAGQLEAQQDYRIAFSFAARYKLPILFVVANTLTPGNRQKNGLGKLDAEFGLPVFSVDANDAIAAYRVATEALHNARHLRGPCVIEALTAHRQGSSTVIALGLLRGYMERHGTRPL